VSNFNLAPASPNPLAGVPTPIKLTHSGHFSNLLKESYNRSIIGLSDQLLTGKQRHDLSGYEYGAMFDVGATMLSFLWDIPAFVGGGGIGTFAVKQGMKTTALQALKQQGVRSIEKTTKLLSKNGADPKVLNDVRNGLYKSFITEGDRLVKDASGLALISGTHEYLNQEISGDDIEFTKIMSKSLTGLASLPMGRALGVAAPVTVRGKVPKITARAIGEATGFTLPYAWEQGKALPSPQDIAVTAGILGGVNMLSRGLGGYKKNLKQITDETNKAFGNKNSFKFSQQPKEIQTLAQKELMRRKEGIDVSNRYFYDNQGVPVKMKSYKNGEVSFVRGSETKLRKMKEDEFFKTFSIEASKNSPRHVLIKSIGDGLDTMGMTSVADSRRTVFSIRGGNIPENLGKNQRGLSVLSDKELYHLNRRIHNKIELETIAKELKAVDQYYSTSYLGGPFGGLQRAYDKITLDLFPQKLSWMRSVESKLSQPGVPLEAKYMLSNIENKKALEASIIAKVNTKLQKSGLLEKINDEKAMRALTAELETTVGKPESMSNGARVLREVLEDLWNVQTKSGLNIVGYEKKYAPRFIDDALIDVLTDIRMGLAKEMPELYAGVPSLLKNKDVKNKALQVLNTIIKDNKNNKGVTDYFGQLNKYYKNDPLKVFQELDANIMQNTSKPFYNITKKRTADISWKGDNYSTPIFDTNAVRNVMKYAKGAANQISTKRFFGENFDDALLLMDDLRTGAVGGRPDKMTYDTMKEVIARVSGYIELDPSRNWKNKKLIQDLVNLEIATKIGLGTATAVNVTQPLISSLFLSNYRVGIPSYINRFVKKERKEILDEMGMFEGSEVNKTIEVLAGVTRRGNRATDKIVDEITSLTGFTGINNVNLQTSASMGLDMMPYLNRIANGEQVMLKGVPLSNNIKEKIINDTLAGQARQSWAKRKLYRDFGVIWEGKKNLSAEELKNGALKFARDSQLQRNYLKEPLFITEPKFRPFILLKTFGFKQAKLIKDGLNREVSEGNILPVVRLAVGASVGAKVLNNSIEFITNIISGKDEYDYRQSRMSFEEMNPMKDGQYKKADYYKELLLPTIDELASVGSLGVVSDIMAAENKLRTLEFIVEPVILDDFGKVWNGIKRVSSDLENYGLSGATRRSPQYFSGLFGSNVKRFVRRYETPQQLEQRLKVQRGTVNKQIILDIYEGRDEQARTKLESWNRAHPDNPILEPDAEDILRFLYEKKQKRENP
jgi:hypothetical protein